jgi:PhnB protein
MTQRIIPYLTVKGATDAIAFYAKAFGAVETKRQVADDGKRLMHASVTINGGTVMLADEFAERGGTPAPTLGKTTSVAVAITLDSAGDVDATFDRALAAGARPRRSPTDMFWGGRFAVVEDPFGHRWMLSAPFNQSEEGT